MSRHAPLVGVLLIAAAVEGVLEVASSSPTSDLIRSGLRLVVFAACAVTCLARANRGDRDRPAWLAFGAALTCWTLSLAVTEGYAALHGPTGYPSLSDGIWLSSYAFLLIGFGSLARRELLGQPLGRWLDGLSFVLVVAIPYAGLLLQPLAVRSPTSGLATSFNYAFPVLDGSLLGIVLGTYALRLWRPGPRWLLLGSACALLAVADAVLAVQIEQGRNLDGDFDVAFSLAAIALAAAARTPRSIRPPAALLGSPWRSIALPLAVQLVAVATQLVGLVVEIGSVERPVTIAVLVVGLVQLVGSRGERIEVPVAGQRKRARKI